MKNIIAQNPKRHSELVSESPHALALLRELQHDCTFRTMYFVTLVKKRMADVWYYKYYISTYNFLKVIEKAKITCESSGVEVSDHFAGIGKMIEVGKGGLKQIDDIALKTKYNFITV